MAATRIKQPSRALTVSNRPNSTVIRRAFARAAAYDAHLSDVAAGTNDVRGLASDRSLADVVVAQARSDKILGIDAPTRVDASLAMLVTALREADDPERPLA